MQFRFPVKSINDKAWFVDESSYVNFGTVKIITVAINENECKVYYRFVCEDNTEFTVEEAQVCEDAVKIPTPQFSVGEKVVYANLGEDGKHHQVIDSIEEITIGITDNKTCEVIYYMLNRPPKSWVMEDEILCYAEEKTIELGSNDDMPPLAEEEMVTVLDYTGTGASDM